jgi:hypothetical protein
LASLRCSSEVTGVEMSKPLHAALMNAMGTAHPQAVSQHGFAHAVEVLSLRN